jgi:hypothetical protein
MTAQRELLDRRASTTAGRRGDAGASNCDRSRSVKAHNRWLGAMLVAGALPLGGCFGKDVPLGSDDAGYGVAPDLQPLCSGNNDGVIARGELVFPLGATVNYLVNPPGTTQAVAPDGAPSPDGPVYDLTSTAGDVHAFTLTPVAGQWFAGSFPGGDYAIVSDVASGILGIYHVTDQAVLLLGFASADPNTTLLVYDQPVTTLRFPVTAGDGFVTGGKITGGTLNGQPFASTDTYRVSVDGPGVGDLPYLKFPHTLRVRVDLTQAVPAGVQVSRIEYLYYHECYGELGRMVSNLGETDPSFSVAAEFRRLAL